MAAQLARNDLLRHAVAIYFPGRGPTTAARLLQGCWRRHADTAWERKRDLDQCPQRHAERLEELLWRVMRLDEKVLSVARLRRILAEI